MVTVTTGFTVNVGKPANQFQQADYDALSESLGSVLEVDPKYVDIINVTDATPPPPPEGRVALVISSKLGLQAIPVDVVSQIIYPLVDYPEYNADASALFADVSETLTRVVVNTTTFQKALVNRAKTLNATALVGVTVEPVVTIQPPDIVYPPTAYPTLAPQRTHHNNTGVIVPAVLASILEIGRAHV